MASMSVREAPPQHGFPSNYTLRAVLYINDTPRDMLSYNYNLTRARVSTIPTSSARTALVLNYTNSLPPRSNSTEYMNAPHTPLSSPEEFQERSSSTGSGAVFHDVIVANNGS